MGVNSTSLIISEEFESIHYEAGFNAVLTTKTFTRRMSYMLNIKIFLLAYRYAAQVY